MVILGVIMSKNLGGRPKVDIARNKFFIVRLTATEHDALMDMAKKAGGTASDYVRQLITRGASAIGAANAWEANNANGPRH